MSARILIVGKARTISAQIDAIRRMGLVPGGPLLQITEMAVASRSASGARATVAARPPVLPRAGRAAPLSSPRESLSRSRGNWRSADEAGALLFELAGTRPAVVAPATQAWFLRRHQETLSSPAVRPYAAGQFAGIGAALAVAVGLTVFGLIAGISEMLG
jgi:hypothetical protein